MVSFKDKMSNSKKEDNKENVNNAGGECEIGGKIVDFKSKIAAPPGPSKGGGVPGEAPGEGGPVADQICSCLGDKLDQIDIDINNTYDNGPAFNTGKLFTQATTPIPIDEAITQPSPNPAIIGFYDETLVAPRRNGINASRIWVIADPDGAVNPNDPFLYVRISTGGSSTFGPEIPIRTGEDWGFRDVFSFRIRSSVAGQQYRITTDPHRTTYVSTIVNIPPGSTSAATVPIANRPSFTDINITVGLIDNTLPSIAVPNGFALAIRHNVTNPFGSKIFTSAVDATISTLRNTLFPGDVKLYNITNASKVHVAADQNGLILDISVEQ